VIARIALRQHSDGLSKLLLRNYSIHDFRVWRRLLIARELKALFLQKLVLLSYYVQSVREFLMVSSFSWHWTSHLFLKKSFGVHVWSTTSSVLTYITFTWVVAADSANVAGISLICDHGNLNTWIVGLGAVCLVTLLLLLLFIFLILIEALWINYKQIDREHQNDRILILTVKYGRIKN